jgi:hypothetical protein
MSEYYGAQQQQTDVPLHVPPKSKNSPSKESAQVEAVRKLVASAAMKVKSVP